ncbi:MAG: ABC transporter ATP-binding protein [Aristaeellaceae bacterium]
MADKQPLLQVEHLHKHFKVGRNAMLHAVDDVSFTMHSGESLGLVGESGCGKTTLGRTLMKLYSPDEGRILFHGEDITHVSARKQRELYSRMQMIYQDPYASLNPFMTIGEIVSEGLTIQKNTAKGRAMTRQEREKIMVTMLERVGLNREHANRFPHEFSGGQRQRAGIARALAVNPEFVVCDEAVSALDVSVQAQIINLLMDLQDELGLTYLFIAHDLSVVRCIATRVAVMYMGKIVEVAPTQELFDHPANPYTIGLLNAVPEADPRYEKSKAYTVMPGEIKTPVNPKPGCRFADRCPRATERCRQADPPMVEVAPGHFCACLNP